MACCLQKFHFKYKETDRLKVKGWKMTDNANINKKTAGEAILIILTKQISKQRLLPCIKRGI